MPAKEFFCEKGPQGIENKKGCHRFLLSATAIKENFLFAPLTKTIFATKGYRQANNSSCCCQNNCSEQISRADIDYEDCDNTTKGTMDCVAGKSLIGHGLFFFHFYR
jgi:hypothetical protein